MDNVGKSKSGTLRTRFNRSRGAAELAADIAFALLTLLVLFAVFMTWQTWLIARTQSTVQDLARDKTEALARVTAAVAAQRQQVARALSNPGLRTALDGGDPAARERATQLLRALLPDARNAAFYSAALDEVLKGNLQQIGYARASQLLRAQGDGAATPVEVRGRAPQIASYAQPIADSHGTILAYVAVDMPFAPIRASFDAIGVGNGRLALRQGDGSDDLLLAERGQSNLSTDEDPGVPVSHSRLRIAAAGPGYWLPITRSLTVAALLAGLSLVAAIILFFVRARIRSRATDAAAEEPSLSQVTEAAARQSVAATPAAVSAAESPAPRGAGTAPAGAVERGIFRAYDIRGVVGQSLTDDTARAIGRAIGSVMRDKDLSEIVVGRDGRLSGPQMAGALIEGLRGAGIDVVDIGQAPTPVTYFASFHLNTGSCVSVTGSHNPPDYNGFKIVVGGDTLAEDAIQDLYARIAEGRLAEGRGSLRKLDVMEDYVQRIASDIQTGRALKVVVDCGNGIAGNVVPQVIQAIGCEAIPLYCDVD
ncbi:MAG TPA: phosphomannomutase/phosphoglucomutase, partial [Rhodanobacteraceae bacterium]|nr:phosphomannomutase/phosphoglucomutase [Rhodanobacteraceae bacterium]